VFESPSVDVLNFPDNITVSPRAGIVLCEDGSGREYLHGLSTHGEIFKFAENNVVIPADKAINGISGDFSDSEWAGATFDVGGDGNWLFVNIQTPGITFAITGPRPPVCRQWRPWRSRRGIGEAPLLRWRELGQASTLRGCATGRIPRSGRCLLDGWCLRYRRCRRLLRTTSGVP
jgi:secreted PhoX family phosphatase